MSCSNENSGMWTPTTTNPSSVRLPPGADVRLLAQPVDARPRPEVHEDHATSQLGGAERLGVEPRGRAVRRGQVHMWDNGHVVLLPQDALALVRWRDPTGSGRVPTSEGLSGLDAVASAVAVVSAVS